MDRSAIRASGGLTLIEVAIALSILAVVGLALTQASWPGGSAAGPSTSSTP